MIIHLFPRLKQTVIKLMQQKNQRCGHVSVTAQCQYTGPGQCCKLGQHFSFLFLVSTRMLYHEINHEVDMKSKAGRHPSRPAQKMCNTWPESLLYQSLTHLLFLGRPGPRIVPSAKFLVTQWHFGNQIFNSVPFYGNSISLSTCTLKRKKNNLYFEVF